MIKNGKEQRRASLVLVTEHGAVHKGNRRISFDPHDPFRSFSRSSFIAVHNLFSSVAKQYSMNYQSITNSHPAAQSGRDNDLKSAVAVPEEAEASTTKENSKGGTQSKKRKPRNVWTAAVSNDFSSPKSLLAYAPHTLTACEGGRCSPTYR